MAAATGIRKPLEGVRVLELGALVAAPYCGMLLADLGADVIKVEPPEGDMARRFAPFVEGESAFFLAVNRSKRSVVLDLRDADDVRRVQELAGSSDVVLHNYRTGVAERIGLGYEDLSEANPRLIYCAISGFGPTGPMALRPGIDLLFQAESGMMAVTGEPGGAPVKVGTNAADVYAATMASTCILAALADRSRTGRGTRVDVALRDAFLALQACWVTGYLATGVQPEPLGSASPYTAPTDVYPTADEPIVLAVVNEKHWRILCAVLGLPADDPRFASNESRVEHAELLRELILPVLATRRRDEWLAALDRAGIPGGSVMDYADVVDDVQVAANQMIMDLDHAAIGGIRVQGIPFWFDGLKPDWSSAPPVLGEDTTDVLASLGGAGPWRV